MVGEVVWCRLRDHVFIHRWWPQQRRLQHALIVMGITLCSPGGALLPAY